MSRPQSLNVQASQESSEPPQLRPRKYCQANDKATSEPLRVSAEVGTWLPDTSTRQMSHHIPVIQKPCEDVNHVNSRAPLSQPPTVTPSQPASLPVYSDDHPPVVECLVPLIGRISCLCCTSHPKTVSDLKTHLRRTHNIHSLDTPTTCLLCQRQFKSFQAASRHYTACSRKHVSYQI